MEGKKQRPDEQGETAGRARTGVIGRILQRAENEGADERASREGCEEGRRKEDGGKPRPSESKREHEENLRDDCSNEQAGSDGVGQEARLKEKKSDSVGREERRRE